MWAELLAAALEDVAKCGDELAWRRLLMLPKAVLVRRRGGKGKAKGKIASARDDMLLWRDGKAGEVWENTRHLQRGEGPPPPEQDAESRERRAVGLAREGQASRAASALVSWGLLAVTDNVLQQMRDKHPVGEPVDRAQFHGHAKTTRAPVVDVYRELCHFKNGTASGPTGLKPAHIRAAAEHEEPHKTLQSLAAVMNDVAAGQVPKEVLPLLMGANIRFARTRTMKRHGRSRWARRWETQDAQPGTCFRRIPGGDFELLGAPIGSKAHCEEWMRLKVQEFFPLLRALKGMQDSQVAASLLRQCGAFSRVVFYMRCTGHTGAREYLETFDRKVEEALCGILGSDESELPPEARVQAGLAVRRGGLGIRWAVDHSEAAVLAVMSGTHDLCRKLDKDLQWDASGEEFQPLLQPPGHGGQAGRPLVAAPVWRLLPRGLLHAKCGPHRHGAVPRGLQRAGRGDVVPRPGERGLCTDAGGAGAGRAGDPAWRARRALVVGPR